jgi:hypothetical protein
VSREVLDPTPALGPQAVALLALARLLPERAVLELRITAAQPSHPVRRAFLHVADCAHCQREALVGGAALCRRAARVLEPARGWRVRRAGSPA